MIKEDINFKKYYLIGFVLLAISLLIIAFGFVLPFIIGNDNNEIIKWISLIIIIIGIISLFPTFYLLKKGNKLRLNSLLENKTNEKVIKRK